MSSRHDFPATSIGRSTGLRMHHAVAHEVHDTHPLLLSSTSPAGGSMEQVHTTANGAPKYVPYTPRQRVTPTAATTGTIVHPSSPQHQQGDATSKLQLMHLKAAAQTIGLDSGTLGWAILEKLVLDVEISEEWSEIWNAVTTGRATLLLPLESASHEKITSDFVKDHVVLCDSSSRKGSPIITLSGLRGTLNEETLIFRSTLHPSSKLFQDILNPATRTSSLSLLPPLPSPPSEIPQPHYPEFTLPNHTSTLHLPPRSSAINNKPPLPPRPGTTRPSATPTTSSTSRLGNPFASLFGGNYKAPTPAPVPSSPPASLRSIDSGSQDTTPVEVSAFTIDRRIVRRDVGREVNKVIKAELKARLAAATDSANGNFVLPGWVVDRVADTCSVWFPFVKDPASGSAKKKLSMIGADKGGKDGKDVNGGYVVNLHQESAEDTAERLQDFYFCLEQDMRSEGTPFVPRYKDKSMREGSKENESESELEAEKEKETEKRIHHRLESETRVRDIMEAVERTVTGLFYDRLFMQPSTDDSSHDEALSSRVAALNMLDLGLRHLGIDVGETANASDELDVVVKACGEMLGQLNSCYCPADKAAILVAAHKIVVDGLSRLPPIRLISEQEQERAREEKRLQEEDGLLTAKPLPSGQSQTQSEKSNTSTGSFPIDIPSSNPSSLSQSKTWSQASPIPPNPTSPSEPVPKSPSKVDGTISPDSGAKLQVPTSQTSLPASGGTKHVPPPLSLTPPTKSAPSVLEVHPTPPKPTPVSGDVLLPLIIFSVVKSNPAHLVSNLLFTQRFRNQSVGGEESYCLINLMAVAEFIENVDLSALGLGDTEKVMSIADLTPIPLTRSPVTSDTPLVPADGAPHDTIRGRVEQQVDAIADSANKVISGVVDSSFGILRSFMPGTSNPASVVHRSAPTTPKLENAELKVGSASSAFGGLLRKDSGFSIANLAASLPIPVARGRSGSTMGGSGEEGQQLVAVSRPSSVKSRSSLRVNVGGESDEDDEDNDDEDEEEGEEGEGTDDESVASDAETDASETGDGEEGEGEGEVSGVESMHAGGRTDARSIRSFESMLSASREKGPQKQKKKQKHDKDTKTLTTAGRPRSAKQRKSLTDRLASVSAIAGRKGSEPPSRRESLLQAPAPQLHSAGKIPTSTSPTSSRADSPALSPPAQAQRQLKIAPPKQRFIECTPDDLRLSEVGELLREYRRLVEAIRDVDGFEESLK